jgi:hypothetical protein
MTITFAELTQKQVEDFDKARPAAGDVNPSVFTGTTVRAAIKAGWFVDPPLTLAEIDAMKPGKVNSLSRAVWEKYNELMTFDPL